VRTTGGSRLVARERVGAVAVLRLDRPAVRNALGSALVAELDDTLHELAADPAVRAVVLTGAAPGFCAGSDLKELAGMTVPELVRHEAATAAVARAIAFADVPVLAAVEGFALGGGFLLATSCDLVVSAADARWGLPEVRLGWVPPWGLRTLAERAGTAAARRLAWGAEEPSAADLHRLGVLDEVVAPGTALARATELATRLAELPAHAVASTKRAFAATSFGLPADDDTLRLFGVDCQAPEARASLDRFARRRRAA
jgi:enoyl-CoA hydratase/carnithine racemase